jgi:hypothetical protein
VSQPAEPESRGYDDFYGEFDSPLMQRLRLDLSGHRKTGHLWTGQNRPLDATPNVVWLLLMVASFFVFCACLVFWENILR